MFFEVNNLEICNILPQFYRLSKWKFYIYNTIEQKIYLNNNLFIYLEFISTSSTVMKS